MILWCILLCFCITIVLICVTYFQAEGEPLPPQIEAAMKSHKAIIGRITGNEAAAYSVQEEDLDRIGHQLNIECFGLMAAMGKKLEYLKKGLDQ